MSYRAGNAHINSEYGWPYRLKNFTSSWNSCFLPSKYKEVDRTDTSPFRIKVSIPCIEVAATMLPRWRFAAAGRYRAHDDEGPEDRRFRLDRQFSVSNSGKSETKSGCFLFNFPLPKFEKQSDRVGSKMAKMLSLLYALRRIARNFAQSSSLLFIF